MIELQLNLDIRALIIASRRDLKLGPQFAEVWWRLLAADTKKTCAYFLGLSSIGPTKKAQEGGVIYVLKCWWKIWSDICYKIIFYIIAGQILG